MYRFGGDRQPKQPVPPGDSAFFYHGECVATSAINSPSPFQDKQRQLGPGGFDLDELDAFLASFTVTSHTCNLNICLGGGGFNCIAFYSGTSFVFDVGEQISRSNPLCGGDVICRTRQLKQAQGIPEPFNGEIKLPPPFPSTIIGGTGRYVQFKV